MAKKSNNMLFGGVILGIAIGYLGHNQIGNLISTVKGTFSGHARVRNGVYRSYY